MHPLKRDAFSEDDLGMKEGIELYTCYYKYKLIDGTVAELLNMAAKYFTMDKGSPDKITIPDLSESFFKLFPSFPSIVLHFLLKVFKSATFMFRYK